MLKNIFTAAAVVLVFSLFFTATLVPVKAVAGDTYMEPIKYLDHIETTPVTEFITETDSWLCDTPDAEYNPGETVILIVNNQGTATKSDDTIVKIF